MSGNDIVSEVMKAMSNPLQLKEALQNSPMAGEPEVHAAAATGSWVLGTPQSVHATLAAIYCHDIDSVQAERELPQ